MDSLNHADLKGIADEMLKPYEGFSDESELPSELCLLKEVKSALVERCKDKDEFQTTDNTGLFGKNENIKKKRFTPKSFMANGPFFIVGL